MELNPYQSFIHISKYSRWLPDKGRREYWEETVTRFTDYMSKRFPDVDMSDIHEAVLNHKVMPSMRILFAAGPAHEREEISGFNCAFAAVDHPRVFDEAVYILMNGTGLGFSAESEHVNKLPDVPSEFSAGDTIVVPDSKEGWAQSYRKLIDGLYNGIVHTWDVSNVRPAGAPLFTFGGRASGPEPLVELFEFTIDMFKQAAGRKLKPIEAHEIMCKIGSVVVAGSTRRSALISLSDLEDTEIRDAKRGEFWNDKPHLSLSNNSVAYKAKPSRAEFDAEFDALVSSGTGERGIYSKYGAQQSDSVLGRDMSKVAGINPCGEIFLRNGQFCNLSSVAVRPEDTEQDLHEKITVAAKLGTLQATFTDFGEVRDIWAKNTAEERLLGISLNGIMGNTLTASPDPEMLARLRMTAHDANRIWADKLGIEPSKAITTVKPEGTSSQLVGTASGIHPWHSDQYIRRVRGSKHEPVSNFLMDQGVRFEQDVYDNNNYVFEFPVRAPDEAVTRDSMTAIEQLEHWLVYKTHWTDHSPSVTINVKDGEWETVREWVWEHFDQVSGLSFLPEDAVYVQAPFEQVDDNTFDQLVAYNPDSLDWTQLHLYEHEDTTEGAQELACVGGACAI